ncbi:MAG: glycosyltransferase [Bacteroidales bacterium]|nr:glycosyltransferase [Bacteroidales bacterium]
MAVTNDMVTDQRVHRSATTLADAGWQVTVVGRRMPRSGLPRHASPESGRPYAVRRFRLLFNRKALFYAEYNARLWLYLLFCKADLVYANDTDTLPACMLAAKLRRRRLFFDAHEMFPEVPELQHRPRVKRVWQRIEDCLFPHLKASCTVCQSIADAYAGRYGIKMAVVRNLPLRAAAPKPEQLPDGLLPACPGNVKHTLLYQGAVNLGRGLEIVIDALRWLPDCRLVVAGVGDVLDNVQKRAVKSGHGDRVVFLGRVKPAYLHRLTPTASLGLCLLDDLGLNYRYALPNRVGDFVQACVPILATDFPELHRVVAHYGIGKLVDPSCNEPQQLAAVIAQTLAEWDAMPHDERTSLFERAARELCWENERQRLLDALGV